ncbi:MAG: transferase, partial [Planctomycetota bacterium]|nr:transferase [Planctomycetota bacterium]
MPARQHGSHGDGRVRRKCFGRLGRNVIIERGAMVFHPENIKVGNNVYIGHYVILKAYHRNLMEIGDGSWIGQMAFLHSAGGIKIGENVGIGPGVIVLT